jgi:nitrogen fixation protein FixH
MRTKGWYWPWLIGALLVATVAGQGVMIYAAASDKTMSIEPDYYNKAVAWDSTASLDSISAILHWKADVKLSGAGTSGGDVVLILTDAAGDGVTDAHVKVTAIHNLDGARHLEAVLTERADGRYVAHLPLDHAGLWEVRVRAERGADHFRTTTRADAPAR